MTNRTEASGAWKRAVLGLGSNLGSREAMLSAAADLLGAMPEVRNVRVSSVRETQAQGPVQPAFLNAGVYLETLCSPDELMALALGIEARLERVRDQRWGPRTLDVDILWIEDTACASEALTVPHPRLHARRFALAPLVELVPEARDPRDQRLFSEVLTTLPEDSLGAQRPLAMRCEGVEVEHTADACFEVRASDRAGLLAGAGEMLAGLVIEPESVEMPQSLRVECKRPEGTEDWGDDERMFAWLSEVLYAVDGLRFAVRRCVLSSDDEQGVRGVLLGEPVDEAKHRVRGAIKAVTFHAMEVGARPEGGWFARVVVDV